MIHNSTQAFDVLNQAIRFFHKNGLTDKRDSLQEAVDFIKDIVDDAEEDDIPF